MTLNNTWGYSATDENWKKPDDVVFKLADITSKGGNLLLNIGPDARGNIPKESNRILKKVGSWLKVNGDSIYGAEHTIDMPYVIPWGVCTMKPGHLYLHVFKYPMESQQIWLFNLKIKVTSIKSMATGEKLEFTQTYEPARNEDRFRIFVPKNLLDPIDTVIDVSYEDVIQVVPLEMLDKMYI